MYKVEKQILDKVTKVLDDINKPVPSNKKELSKYLEDRKNTFKQASKLSKLIKDNYTEVELYKETEE